MTQQTPNTVPLHHFREAVAQRLATAPYNWGSSGYELERRYNDVSQEDWEAGLTVDDAAGAIHTLQMSRSQRVYAPTRASLERAGCRFITQRVAITLLMASVLAAEPALEPK